MKRNKERFPEFDEIIFENRNKEYGAYQLRTRYKSTASFSVLCGISLVIILVTGLSLKPNETQASDPGVGGIIIMPEPVEKYLVEPVRAKQPEELMRNALRNIEPVVTDRTDSSDKYIPTTGELLNGFENPGVFDTLIRTEVIEVVIPPEPEPQIWVAEMPLFPGGETALLKYIIENTRYPQEALENNVQGRVFMKFVVKSDGSIGKIEILKGVDPLLDAEAMRVIGNMPDFTPGKQNGVPVPVWFSISVVFEIAKR